MEARAGQIILTPVRIHRGDAVRAKLAELDLTESDVADAIAWVRTTAQAPALAAEPAAPYAVASRAAKPKSRKKAALKKPASKA